MKWLYRYQQGGSMTTEQRPRPKGRGHVLHLAFYDSAAWDKVYRDLAEARDMSLSSYLRSCARRGAAQDFQQPGPAGEGREAA